MSMRFVGLTLLSTLSLLSVAGCAFTPAEVYPPANPTTITSTKGRGREVLVVGPFLDQREKQICGKKTNGLGMTTSHIDCATPPGTWVAVALEDGFRKNGYTVLPRGTAPRADTIIVYGSVKEFFITPPIAFASSMVDLNARINLDVRAPHQDDLSHEISVVGKAAIGLDEDATYDQAAANATKLFVSDAVDAVSALVDHPEAAAAEHWHGPPEEHLVIGDRSARAEPGASTEQD